MGPCEEQQSTWSTKDIKSGVFDPMLVKDAPGCFTQMFAKDHMGEQTPGDTYTTVEKPCRKKTPSEAEARHPWLPQLWIGQKGRQQESEMAHKFCKGYSVIYEFSFQQRA